MAFAACSDLLTMRISNGLVVLVIASFLLLAFVAGLPFPTIGIHFAAGALVLAVTFGMFAMGWIGGGDAKLVAAIAIWMGFELLLPYLLYAAVFGGVLTLLLLVGRRYALPGPLLKASWLVRLHHPKTGVPYGIALALAAMLVYPQTFAYERLVTNPTVQQTLLDGLRDF